MPWHIEKSGDGKHCVIKDSDGSKAGCHDTPEKAKKQMAALYANEKLEQAQNVILEGVGPALVAAAVTAKPHLRQRGKEIKIVELNGEKFVEIPLLKKGIFRHPKGKLIFDDKFLGRMVDNHKNKVTDYNVHLDFRHSDKVGALAFLDPDDGGWLEIKEDWLYGYGKPTDDEAVKIIESRKWRYASPEFAPNYESNFVQKLSSDDLTEIQLEDLIKEMEVHMPKKLTLGDVTLELEIEDEQVTQIVAAYTKATEKVTALEEKVSTLKAQVSELTPDPEPEIPESYRLRLEALETENRRLEQERREEKVNVVLERAKSYRDSRGYGHDKVLLELATAALKLSEYKVDDTRTIKLEKSEKLSDVIGFYNRIIMTMLEKVPGTVPMSTRTQGDDNRMSDGFDGHYTMEEFEQAQEDFWK